MKFKTNLRLICVITAISAASISTRAQTDILQSRLPLDTTIHHRVLDNGFTYYIKPLESPQPHLQMNFYVKTGYHTEGTDELGFSHLIEHLAFEETQSFPDGLANNADILSSLGMYRKNFSGSTSTTFTEYEFSAPIGNPEAVKTGMLWFRDIAVGLDISESSINTEKGVILQEYRGGDALRNETLPRQKMNHELFPCSPYAENHQKQLMNFSFQAVQKYYEKWYRPDRMALVISGTIQEVDTLEELIVQTFSGLENKAAELTPADCFKKYFESEPGFSIVQKKSGSETGFHFKPIEINMIFRDSTGAELQHWAGIRRGILGKELSKIIRNRLKQAEEVYNSTYDFFSVYQIESFPNSLKVSLQTDEGSEMEALQKAILVLNQLRYYGISAEELKEAKEEVKNSLDAEQPSQSQYWIHQMKNHFVNNEALPGKKIAELKKWVNSLSSGDFGEVINDIIGSMPEDIGIKISEKSHTEFTSERVIRDSIRNLFEIKPQLFTPRVTQAKLMSEKEINSLQTEPGMRIKIGEGGEKILELKNGLIVILKTSGKTSSGSKGEILLHGFSPKGASCFSPEDYASAMFAPSVVKYSGIGNMNKQGLQEIYNSVPFNFHLMPYIHLQESGIKAEVSEENLEDLLQLVFLYFTQPRYDELAFKDWKNLRNLPSAPINDLLALLKEVTGDTSELAPGSKIDALKNEVDHSKVYRIYEKLFANAQDFTFILTGDFDEDHAVPLLEKYLGNLPVRKTRCVSYKVGDSLLSGPVSVKAPALEHYNTKNFHYAFQYVLDRTEKDDWKEEVKIKLLGAVLNRLLYDFRARDGFSLYYFGAGGRHNKEKSRYEILLRITCIPEEFPLIREKLSLFIEDLKMGKISPEIFSEAKTSLAKAFDKTRLDQPEGIAESLYEYYRYAEPSVAAAEIEDYFQSLNFSEIAETAKEQFRDENLYQVLMEPDSEGNNF